MVTRKHRVVKHAASSLTCLCKVCDCLMTLGAFLGKDKGQV